MSITRSARRAAAQQLTLGGDAVTMRPRPGAGAAGGRLSAHQGVSEDSRNTIRRVTFFDSRSASDRGGCRRNAGRGRPRRPRAGDVALGAGASYHHGGISAGGRCRRRTSEVLQTLRAVDRPAPDIPEMITSSGMAVPAPRRLRFPCSPVLRFPVPPPGRLILTRVLWAAWSCVARSSALRSCSVMSPAPVAHREVPRTRAPEGTRRRLGFSSSMISPVAVFTAGAAGAALARATAIVSAVLRPMPGTS